MCSLFSDSYPHGLGFIWSVHSEITLVIKSTLENVSKVHAGIWHCKNLNRHLLQCLLPLILFEHRIHSVLICGICVGRRKWMMDILHVH